ncbi:MAG: hypothetical protein ACI9S8_000286 [Chlamydiales bacterium]|jgi:hypothetical protein
MTLIRKLKDHIGRLVKSSSLEDDGFESELYLEEKEKDRLQKLEDSLLAMGNSLMGGTSDSGVVGVAVPYKSRDQGKAEPVSLKAPSSFDKGSLTKGSVPSRPFILKENQGSYPGDFKEIYSLENVDINTVRRVSEASTSVSEKKRIQEAGEEEPFEEDQKIFDFGQGFRDWMGSLMLHEPIEVLSLSAQPQKALLENGKKIIQDIVNYETSDFLKFKGMGQGHIDEVQQTLEGYLKGSPLNCVRQVDFCSLLKCLLGEMERKQLHCLLWNYGLSDLFTLSTADNATVRHWNNVKHEECRNEALNLLESHKKRKFLEYALGQIASAFIVPWMLNRQGIASRRDVFERLSESSTDRAKTKAVLSFLGDTYFNGKFLLCKDLLEVEPGVYCANPSVAEQYQSVLGRVKSYFYKRGISYTLREIIGFLLRECAMEWVLLHEDFVLRTLRKSPTFRVRKGPDGELVIRLA